MSKSQDRRVAVQREADPIARLRELLSEATPGPWEGTDLGNVVSTSGDRDHHYVCDVTIPADAPVIAALYTLAPELLATRDSLETLVREIEFRCAPGLPLSGEARKARAVLDALRARAAEVLR